MNEVVREVLNCEEGVKFRRCLKVVLGIIFLRRNGIWNRKEKGKKRRGDFGEEENEVK